MYVDSPSVTRNRKFVGMIFTFERSLFLSFKRTYSCYWMKPPSEVANCNPEKMHIIRRANTLADAKQFAIDLLDVAHAKLFEKPSAEMPYEKKKSFWVNRKPSIAHMNINF